MVYFRWLRFSALIALLAGVYSVRPVLGGQTYYVAPTGSDANSGSASSPLRQIQAAITKVHPGDLILVADGTYLGFDIDNTSGSNGAPITIRVTGTNAVVLVTTNRPDNRDTIFINDSSYVTVDGLRAFNANRAALRIQDGDHVTIRNCVFGNNQTWGILTGQSPDLLIENNECYGSVAQHGIYVANSADRPVVRGNRCHDNFQSGIQLNADVNTPPGDGIITDALVEDNVIYNNGRGGGGAINLDGVQNSVVRNNLLYTNHASGIIFFQIDGAEGPRGNQVLHNTIDQAADGRWALGLLQTTGTNFVRGNILLNRHSFRGGLQMDTTDVTNTVSDYNVLSIITTNDGDSTLTLAQWQARGQDLHSITGALATVFANANAGNYLLRTDSPAVDAAVPFTAMTNDLEGNIRPYGPAPDIGCYEQSPLRLRINAATTNGFQLLLVGGAGRTYQIDGSSDLAHWSSVATFTRSNRPIELVVPHSVLPQFYRASYTP